MNITLYRVACERNRVDKSQYVNGGFNLVGSLKNDTSVIDPVILIEKTNPTLYQYNMMYIYEFDRWYFINDIVSHTNDTWEIHAHCDVLFSWAYYIKSEKAIIDKSSEFDKSNLYLDDGSYVMDSRKYNKIVPFPNGLSENGTFILICAGGV